MSAHQSHGQSILHSSDAALLLPYLKQKTSLAHDNITVTMIYLVFLFFTQVTFSSFVSVGSGTELENTNKGTLTSSFHSHSDVNILLDEGLHWQMELLSWQSGQ